MEEDTSLLIQNKYKLIKLIGCGAYSQVYEGLHIVKNTKVAIKFDIKNNEISKKLLQNEISIYLHLLKHKMNHIANIKSFGLIGSRNYIIMDYLYMDLDNFFKNYYEKINISIINELLNNAFILVNNMHKIGLVHRDIKPENFLFNKNKELCIIDLGLSSDLYKLKPSNKIIGTPLYCSYNIHKSSYYYEKEDDIISIYFMFFHLIGKSLPWEHVKILNKNKNCNTIYQLKKNMDFLEYYKNNENYEYLIPVINSYNNYLKNNEIRFYS